MIVPIGVGPLNRPWEALSLHRCANCLDQTLHIPSSAGRVLFLCVLADSRGVL